MTATISFTNEKIDNYEHHRGIIAAELERYGFTGKWIVSPLKRIKRMIADDNGAHNFDVTRIEHAGSMRGLRIFTMPSGRESTWCSILVPPSKYILEDVLATMRGTSQPQVEETESEEPPVVVNRAGKGANWSRGTLELKLHPGTVYWADVHKIESDHVEVSLTSDLIGVVPKKAWNPEGRFDQKVGFQTCAGERVKVLLVQITDSSLLFDRGSVVNYPDDSVIDPATALTTFSPEIKDGVISLRGFMDHGDNAIWLLEALALEYGTICEDFPFPPTNSITKLWSNMIFERYKCNRVASPLSPLFRAFVTRGWIEPAYIERFGTAYSRERPYGYALTELGWSEANAMDFGAVWLRKVDEHNRAYARTVPDPDHEFPLKEVYNVPQKQAHPDAVDEFDEASCRNNADRINAIGQQTLFDEFADGPDEFEIESIHDPEHELVDNVPAFADGNVDAPGLLEFRKRWVRLADIDQRLAEITSERTSLEAEKQEITEWIGKHPDILKKVQGLKTRREELERKRQELDDQLRFMDQLFG